MELEDLEADIEELLGTGVVFTKSSAGEITIRTGLKEGPDGELVPVRSDDDDEEEDEPLIDEDFELEGDDEDE